MMEPRSTGNPDTSNPAAMSMLEYLAKRGRESMSGICKYPESICPHMTVLKGKSYCDATPCQLTGELPKQTFGDKIRSMNDDELAEIIMCPYDTDPSVCSYKGTCEKCCLEWLKQPVVE